MRDWKLATMSEDIILQMLMTRLQLPLGCLCLDTRLSWSPA